MEFASSRMGSVIFPPLPLDVGVNYQPFLPPSFVEITKFLTAQGGGGTLHSIVLDVLAASNTLGI